MSISHYLDQFPLALLFAATIIVFLFFIEIGFRCGMAHRPNSVKAQISQVRAIMSTTLGLLAFILAFTFATAQMHYETRVQNMVEEANIAGAAFLQADLLEEPTKSRVRTLLYEYIGDRLQIHNLLKQNREAEVLALINKAEEMHRELWALSLGTESLVGNAIYPEPGNQSLINAVLELIDIHNLRLQTTMVNRIPVTILLILYLTAVIAMAVMGYHAGLTGRRTPFATVSLALVFSVVMTLITDLDRPTMSMFEIDSKIMINQHEKMGLKLGLQ